MNDIQEQAYREHLREESDFQEGNGQSNCHPDGCFFCGSQQHHSNDCLERE